MAAYFPILLFIVLSSGLIKLHEASSENEPEQGTPSTPTPTPPSTPTPPPPPTPLPTPSLTPSLPLNNGKGDKGRHKRPGKGSPLIGRNQLVEHCKSIKNDCLNLPNPVGPVGTRLKSDSTVDLKKPIKKSSVVEIICNLVYTYCLENTHCDSSGCKLKSKEHKEEKYKSHKTHQKKKIF